MLKTKSRMLNIAIQKLVLVKLGHEKIPQIAT
jgi:hypothetical protein